MVGSVAYQPKVRDVRLVTRLVLFVGGQDVCVLLAGHFSVWSHHLDELLFSPSLHRVFARSYRRMSREYNQKTKPHTHT